MSPASLAGTPAQSSLEDVCMWDSYRAVSSPSSRARGLAPASRQPASPWFPLRALSTSTQAFGSGALHPSSCSDHYAFAWAAPLPTTPDPSPPPTSLCLMRENEIWGFLLPQEPPGPSRQLVGPCSVSLNSL